MKEPYVDSNHSNKTSNIDNQVRNTRETINQRQDGGRECKRQSKR